MRENGRLSAGRPLARRGFLNSPGGRNFSIGADAGNLRVEIQEAAEDI